MDLIELIKKNVDRPNDLERLYHEFQPEFKKALIKLFEAEPQSLVYSIWYERLTYFSDKESFNIYDYKWIALLAFISGLFARITWQLIDMDLIPLVNILFTVLPVMGVYFLIYHKASKRVTATLSLGLFILLAIINILPNDGSDTTMLGYIHAPIVLWIFLGVAYTGDKFQQSEARLSFLRFNGEFIIMYAIFAISGMILTALTLLLFQFLPFDVVTFYFENIVLIGATSLAVVAAGLVSMNMKLAKNIAPYIARIFSPLVLVTLIMYLGIIIVSGQNPFADRNFLLVFNIVLILVLLISIFSITERGQKDKKILIDFINFGLIMLALLIDSVALLAILFRLTSYGITPNRLAVLGINAIIFMNLVWIIVPYFKFLQGKSHLSKVQKAISHYLPIYGFWAIFVIVIFPLFF